MTRPITDRIRTARSEVWKIVRDFNNYPVWVGGAGESRIEDGKTGDTVGAVRSVLYQERQIRQRLLALSDVERAQTYEFCGAAVAAGDRFSGDLAGHSRSWMGTGPSSNGGRLSIVSAARRDELTGTLRGWFAKWLESLRATLDRLPPGSPPEACGNPGLAAILGPISGRFAADIGYGRAGTARGCCIRGRHLA